MNINEFVSNYIKYMYYNYNYLISSIQPKNDEKDEFPDVDKLKGLLINIDPNTEAPLIMGVNLKRADWFEFLDRIFDTHHNYLTKLETLIPHLPTELIKILAKSDFKTNRTMNFVWFKSWQKANNKRYNNLEFVLGTLMGYVYSIKSLKEYHEKTYGEIKLKDASKG